MRATRGEWRADAAVLCLLVGSGLLLSESAAVASSISEPARGFAESCGVVQMDEEIMNKIINGENAAFAAWPWAVSLRVDTFWVDEASGKTVTTSGHICGGSLINEQWVVTAAHCCGLPQEDYRVRLGELDFHSIGEPLRKTERFVSQIIRHENYSSKQCDQQGLCANSPNDIALLRLQRPVKFKAHIQPICLPPKNIGDLAGRIATTIGWGLTSETGGNSSTILKQVQEPIISNAKCERLYNTTAILDSQLCAGSDADSSGACKGDSGGPLQVRGPSGEWILAGLVSWGEKRCTHPNEPGVYTRVSEFTDWIRSKIHSASQTS